MIFHDFTRLTLTLPLTFLFLFQSVAPAGARPAKNPEQTVNCDILVIGGGLAGTATAYEALKAGYEVCLSDISDWIGGQVSAQGNSALDEGKQQRRINYFPRGYLEFRNSVEKHYGRLNPGDCWVSHSCFIPKDAHQLLLDQLQNAAHRGRGQLKWFPNTVVKELEIRENGRIIEGVIAIEHQGQNLNRLPLSQIYDDIYDYNSSSKLSKKIIRFAPPTNKSRSGAQWYVVEASETGEIVALADVPYRLGLDPRSPLNPSSPTDGGDPYCTQGFTYTFAMERTSRSMAQQQPPFYAQYQPYYGYDPSPLKADFDYVFTYRRILSPQTGPRRQFGGVKFTAPTPGDISLQNWLWGNDYRPGTDRDNLIYTRQQLAERGQLKPGQWQGGLRQETLRKAEEHALGFYYWLVAGTTDSQLGDGVKYPAPNHRFLSGLDSPMGTAHGLSKYPYIRESRRIIGRSSSGYQQGFQINEIDISTKDYFHPYYRESLPSRMYYDVWREVTRLEVVNRGFTPISRMQYTRRTTSTQYADSVGITEYSIDFHPCMQFSPPERPGNQEREQVRWGYALTHPAQIPLRAMIPQKIDNLLVTGKSIATSHVAAAAYRVHPFEWSVGAAAGTTASYALKKGIYPYQLVDSLPENEPELMNLRQIMEQQGNPTRFPDFTSAHTH
jgi:hypothetical protein